MTGSSRHDAALWLAIMTMAGAVACCPPAMADPSPTSPVDSRPGASAEADGRVARFGHTSAKSPKGLPSSPSVGDVPAAPTQAPGKTVRRTPGGADIEAERPAAKAAEPSQAEALARPGSAPTKTKSSTSRRRSASGRRPRTRSEATKPTLPPALHSPDKSHRVPVSGHAATTLSPTVAHELRWDATPSDERPDAPQLSAPTNRVSIRSSIADLARLPLVIGPDSDSPVALRGDLVNAAAVPGSVAMLIVVAIGVALGYRQAKRHDVAGSDVMRFIS
ncbi:hypothetical protein SAMN04488580_10375 [Mycobacterium sp. 283mftsu]|nr:hypothetical protein SAMN04488580_10375 [Mycobacterium sp. 283mftsu]